MGKFLRSPAWHGSTSIAEAMPRTGHHSAHQPHSFRPDTEVTTFLGEERVAVEVGQKDAGTVSDPMNFQCPARAVRATDFLPVKVETTALEVGLNQTENGVIICTQPKREDDFGRLLPGRSRRATKTKPEMPFAINEAADVGTKLMTVDFGGELVNRMARSHDVSFLGRMLVVRAGVCRKHTFGPSHCMSPAATFNSLTGE